MKPTITWDCPLKPTIIERHGGIFPARDDPIHGRWVLAICHGFPKVLQGGSFGKVQILLSETNRFCLSVVWHHFSEWFIVA